MCVSLQYVLSVLNFTYPTIFQGWQTLVGGILLRILLSNKCLSVSSTDLDKAGFISLLPSFLFFSAGIVASSKALANLVSSYWYLVHWSNRDILLSFITCMFLKLFSKWILFRCILCVFVCTCVCVLAWLHTFICSCVCVFVCVCR